MNSILDLFTQMLAPTLNHPVAALATILDININVPSLGLQLVEVAFHNSYVKIKNQVLEGLESIESIHPVMDGKLGLYEPPLARELSIKGKYWLFRNSRFCFPDHKDLLGERMVPGIFHFKVDGKVLTPGFLGLSIPAQGTKAPENQQV